MTDPHYVIRGGAAGRERLRVLARVMRPTTLALLERVGVAPGASVLDVGCGGGDVSLEFARLVGAGGRVVGLDLDATKLELARAEARERGAAQVEFRCADAVAPIEDGGFDLAYARFLLTHLDDPGACLARMVAALRPGGLLVVEDIDFSASFTAPPHAGSQRYYGLYSELVRRRGGDPDIGPRLPLLLLDAGLADVDLHVVQPAGLRGEVKLLNAITLENIADGLAAEGLATPDEIAALAGDLHAFARDPRTVVSIPRIVQAWGRRG